jgi:transposase
MRAYSLDLRRKIVEAVRCGLTKTEVARTFNIISLSSIKRYMKMEDEFGSVVPRKPPGASPKVHRQANPIEEAFSKIKGILRKATARTREALIEELGSAISAITADAALGFFTHAGYQSPPRLL